MDKRYKIIISNNNLYKEIELNADIQQLKVGTSIDCDVRLRKEWFFEQIELTFVKHDSEWTVYCSDNLYLSTGDVRKLVTTGLKHGDNLQIKYQHSDNLVFSMDFFIDFDDGKTKYERLIDVGNCSEVSIGYDKNNNIVLRSAFVKKDAVRLIRKGRDFVLNIIRTTYGVYVNGKKAENGAVLQDGDFLSISDFFFYYKNDRLWTQIRDDIFVNGLKAYEKKSPEQYPKFNRNTREKIVISDEKIEIMSPPQKPKKPKNNLLLRLMPSMGMLIAAGIMAHFGGPMMLVMSGISGLMAILTTVFSMKENNKEYKEECASRLEKYNSYIAAKRAEIEAIRKEEHDELEELYISQAEETGRFNCFSADLFDRRRDDEDYLCVRLGQGDVEAARAIDYKKQERLETDDELQDVPEQICNEYKYVHEAAVVCDLKKVNAVGVIGRPEYRFQLLKNMVIDIAARQYYSDVKMVFVAEKEHKDDILWLRFLPNVYNDYIGTRNIVCDDENRNIVFEYLYKELSIRKQNKSYENEIIVFIYDEYGFKSHPISKFVDEAKDLGVCFIFFGDTRADIAMGCGYIVKIEDDRTGVLVDTQDKSKAIKFNYPVIPNANAEKIVQLLAPVYTEEISLESTLTKNISLFELLNIIAVDDLDLAERWKSTKVYKSMAAPIGVSKTGVVSLDLHDKAHGPHGLVAGTTGSGKSEILQTYILSMATLFSPQEVGFVIIDFKGGGMVNQFKDLPHLLGAITNIDGKAINRSLKSIKAELQKRQRLFAEADVNHIDKYIKKYKNGEVGIPLPHLIIIVDEFAELKAEQPEFMKELISAARIGRSLGVHLILATQKPSGQVNEQIWSNSRFKLCLKVQSQEDSNEVLKSPLAAEIKEPGRAYLQVGNNEIFELFQSAYSGASEKNTDSNVKEFTIYNLTESGRRIPVYSQKKEKSDGSNITQLDSIVNYVHKYCSSIGMEKLPDICLPALEEVIDFPTEKPGKNAAEYSVDLGIYDDPENQYQGNYSIDLAENNLMIIGSSQSGKTNAIQTIIRSLCTNHTPDEVNIYIIDYASMILRNFDKLNHVGGVVCPSEDEKLKNLMKLLNAEIERRKEKLMGLGVSSFTAYKEAGQTDLPLLVLIIDNLTALKELSFKEDDELLNLCREGLSVGLSIVIANSQTNGIGYKYLANFSAKMALFCNDVNEYSSLFNHCRERLDNIPGRSIIEIENRHMECQTYLAFSGEKEIDRVKEIKAYIADTNRKNKSSAATRIPLIPAALSSNYVLEQLGTATREKFSIVAGLDYSTVMPCVMKLPGMGQLAISGREGAGRHNWIKYAIFMLNTLYAKQMDVYVVDGIDKKLSELKNSPALKEYSFLAEDAVKYVIEIEKVLAARYERLARGEENVLEDAGLLMLVIDNRDAIDAICNDMTALEAYRNIVGRYKNMNTCVVCYIENANISYSSPELLKNIRDQKQVLFFDDLANMKLFDPSLNSLRKFKKNIEQGDCYYIRDNDCYKLKTPLHVEHIK